MDIQIEFKGTAIEKLLQDKIQSILDEKAMLEVHNMFAKRCDPFVPMDEGVLAQSVQVYEDRITYQGPYAHYQYIGEVYGPNIPIFENGIIVGWFSIPNMKKHPTGREMQYGTEKHPLASKQWDKAMMASDSGQVFLDDVTQILMKRWKELYG